MLQPFFWIFFILFGLAGCHTTSFKEKPKAKPTPKEVQLTLNQIKSLAKKKGLKTTLKNLTDFINTHKETEALFEAYSFAAELYTKYNKPKQACKIYIKITELPFSYEGQSEAFLKSALCLSKKQKKEEALNLLELRIQKLSKPSQIKNKATAIQWQIVAPTNLNLWKLKILSRRMKNLSVKSKKYQQLKKQGETLIPFLEEQKILESLNLKEDYGHFQAALLYRTGEWQQKERHFKEAKNLFEQALKFSPSLSMAKKIHNYLKILRAQSQVNPYLIGVILPLSGRRKALGEKVLRGLYMGLQIFKNSPWQLIVLDSKSHPDVVKEALEKLLYKHHVIAVIGGLSGETATALAERANLFNIPCLLLSQKSLLTQNKNFVFQSGLSSKSLMKQLSLDLKKTLNLNQMAILYPEDSYGQEYASLFSETFQEELKGEVVKKLSYKRGEVDFKQTLLELFGFNDREEEFEQLKKEHLEKNPSLSKRSKKLKPEHLLEPEKNFQGIFIPDSLKTVKRIQAYLKYFDIKDLSLVGTNLWSLKAKKMASKNFPLVFIDLPFLSQKEKEASFFYKRYKSIFKNSPGFFESQAYTTSRALYEALQSKPRTRKALLQALQNLKTIEGAFYPVSLSENHIFVYPLKTYTTHKGQVIPLDSVPVK